jgi:glycosyltransferase involved in cell wall biosynthesis
VGKGSVAYVSGWCYHTSQMVRELELLVNETPHRLFHRSIARPEVLRDQAGHTDLMGNSLLSGFWALVPIQEIDRGQDVPLSLRGLLDSGERCEASLGLLALQPGRRARAARRTEERSSSQREPLVVICMATYDPPLELFQTQVSSIRAQTHQNWICIINDDCSPESVYEQIRCVASTDERFRVHRNPSRLGIYRNFEKCLSRVPLEAAFVAFSDQDDEWYPEKLAILLSAFDDDTTLAYSDMDIVSAEGRVLSHTFWISRRNNYTSLEALLFANTVTGAASMFRASLLDEILPFPYEMNTKYHDHWVACMALGKGTIKYVNRPLYAYRQHGGNAYGHQAVAPCRLLPELRSAWRWVRARSQAKLELAPALRSLNDAYYDELVYIVLLAKTLMLRLPELRGRKRAILQEFARLDRSWSRLLVQGIKGRLLGRPTLGREWHALRSAVGHWLLNQYYRRNEQRLFHREATRLPAAVPVAPTREGDRDNVEGAVGLVRQMIAPLKLQVSAASPRRVNLVMATINFRYVFAGYIAMFNFAKRLARSGHRVRIVIVEPCDYDPSAWNREIRKYPGLEGLFETVETSYCLDRSIPLDVSSNDVFIATSVWTAHIAHQAVRRLGRERFIFFAQEYEPMFFQMGSLCALAQQAYSFPQLAIFSTDFLFEYFRGNKLGVFADGDGGGEKDAVCFQNAICSFAVSQKELAARRERKLLFYARPEQHAARNMFELGVLGLSETIRGGHFEQAQWRFDGIGSVNPSRQIKLGRGAEMRLMQKVSLEEYQRLLPTYDIGLSLMLTPHPSLVPLEMAAAGLVTVTNTFANKTAERLRQISSNILPTRPTVDGITEGLIAALGKVDDFAGRASGAHVSWCTSWEDAFDAGFMARVEEFIERSSLAP